MPVQIKLGKIFDRGRLGDAVSAGVKKTLKEFAEYVPEQQKKSVPKGRLYRKGSFSGRNTIGGRRAQGRGTRIHRASAPGQRPAIDGGKLVRSTKSRILSKYSGEVTTVAKNKGFDYAAHLEGQMDRPIQDAPEDIRKAEEMLMRNCVAEISKLT